MSRLLFAIFIATIILLGINAIFHMIVGWPV